MDSKQSSYSENDRSSLVSICFLPAVTVCLYAPLSIYLVNKQEFWFNLRIIWYVPVITFLVCLIVSITAGLLFKGKLKSLYLAILFGVGLCFYIQGNFIGIKVGNMNGREIVWESYRTRMVINIAIWVAIIVACVFLFLKFMLAKRMAMYISLLLCAMQIVSLVTLIISGNDIDRELGTATVPVLTTKGLYEVGSDRNIIVFILDTFDEQYFDYVKENAPELLEEFDGFVAYDNFTSVYPTTNYSLTGILNGSLYRNEKDKTEWIEENATKHLYHDELSDNGYDISLYTSELRSIPERIKDITENYTVSPVHFQNTRTCFSLLYRLVGCQYFPDALKPSLWMNGIEVQSTAVIDSNDRVWDDANSKFMEGMEQNGISVVDDTRKYKFIHLFGTHCPCYTDEFGYEAPLTWEWNDCAKGCMRIMSEYIKRLKEQGVYDNSAIIITADHGNETEPGVLSNPFFIIKDFDSHGELKTLSYETGLENFGATIADLAGTSDTTQYGMSILKADENTKFDRYYYQYVWDEDGYQVRGVNGNDFLVEYLTPYDTNDTDRFRLTDVEYTPVGEKIPHIQYCQGCQEMNEKPEYYYGWYILEHRHIKDFPY